MKRLFRFKTEVLLGSSLGLGCLTSLRFVGPIGFSEFFVFCVIISLFLKNIYKIFSFEKNAIGYYKLYCMFSFFMIMPLVTFFVFIFSDYSSSPIYVISFIMGITLTFLIYEQSKLNFNMKLVTIFFAFFFILGNLIFIDSSTFSADSGRFKGGSDNPNQIMFYASSLSLMIVLYLKRLSFLLLPIIVYITLLSGSDAYLLKLFFILLCYVLLRLTYFSFFSFNVHFSILLLVTFLFFLFVISFYSLELITLWNSADEGGGRVNLFVNAIDVTLHSPIFGFGAGSFSGFSHSFDRWEAHNTFLDFAMQFGLFFPFSIYFISTLLFIKLIKNKDFLVASFLFGYILSSFFHFTGRHFIFWVELSIFLVYLRNFQVSQNKLFYR